MGISSHSLLLTALVFLISFFGTYFYRSFAIQKGILANPNFRTLHENPKPRGGGIVFSWVFILAVISLGLSGTIGSDLIMALGVGGGLASFFGFIDDVTNVRATIKMIIQGCLSAWILICFNGGPLVTTPWLPIWFSWLVSWFLLIWLINLYNFMDGVDGMAASGAIYICVVLVLISYFSGGSSFNLSLLCLLLAVSCLGFLLFNWPPATIFMGDSGSVFLGYCFGVLIIKTTMANDINFWTWLVIFGYFLGDTTTTIILRIMIVKRWFGAHRSHAYQNLARILGSHIKVTGGVLVYHIVWLMPLAIWSSLEPELAPIAAAFAFLPSIYWALRFGPLLSSA